MCPSLVQFFRAFCVYCSSTLIDFNEIRGKIWSVVAEILLEVHSLNYHRKTFSSFRMFTSQQCKHDFVFIRYCSTFQDDTTSISWVSTLTKEIISSAQTVMCRLIAWDVASNRETSISNCWITSEHILYICMPQDHSLKILILPYKKQIVNKSITISQ